MTKFYIDGEQVTKAEAIEQNRANITAWGKFESGNFSAALNIKFVLAINTNTGEIVSRENW